MRKGDTLASIAKKRDVEMTELVKLNHDVAPGPPSPRRAQLSLQKSCTPGRALVSQVSSTAVASSHMASQPNRT